jgi:hypothetical protein
MYVLESLLATVRLNYQLKNAFGNSNVNNKYRKLQAAEYIHMKFKVDI